VPDAILTLLQRAIRKRINKAVLQTSTWQTVKQTTGAVIEDVVATKDDILKFKKQKDINYVKNKLLAKGITEGDPEYDAEFAEQYKNAKEQSDAIWGLALGEGAGKAETVVAQGTGNIVKLTRVDDVINESIAGAGVNAGNITSKFGLTADEALTLGDKLLGQGYKEVGKAGSGVFEKQVGNQTYRFRIDNSSLTGNHSPNVPHVHVEILDEVRNILVNNHIPLIE